MDFKKIDLDKVEAFCDKWIKFGIAYEKWLVKGLLNLVSAGFEYAFMVWIYFWIYDVMGWQKTVIALACGVILFGIRSRFNGSK